MLPINFLFLTVLPVVDMRLRSKSGGRDYPPEVPINITKVLELNIVRLSPRKINMLVTVWNLSLRNFLRSYADKMAT